MELFVTKRSGHRHPIDLDKIHRVLDWAAERLDRIQSCQEQALNSSSLDWLLPWEVQERHPAKWQGWWQDFFRIFILEGRRRNETIHEPPFLFGLAKLLEVSFGQVRPP